MQRVGYAMLLIIAFTGITNGQTPRNDTLFSIDKQPYSSASFLRLYQNNKLQGEDQSTLSFNEALTLYINFQLKVREARAYGIDTLPEFLKNKNKFRNKLLQPFLNPSVITEDKIIEAHHRLQFFLKARHILIKVKRKHSPQDTLSAYTKALTIRNKLIKGGDFKKLAKTHSADLLVQSNGGDLGYFTAFQMIYPFETAAYNLKINQISMPVRTRFGYHIIQITDRQPNPGKIKVAHLVIGYPPKASALEKRQAGKKADSLYNLLKGGANFALLTLKHSSDLKSANKAGELPWFSAFQMVNEFEEAAFALPKNGAFTAPVQTPYGWHIIKRIDKAPWSPIEKIKPQIIDLIKKDGRCNIPQDQFLNNLKSLYNVKEYRHQLSNFYSILDYAYADLTPPLFIIEDTIITQEQFSNHLSKQPSKEINEDFKDYIIRIYDNFVNNSILAYHKNQLEKRHPHITETLEEYLQGFLAYNISNQKVWTPSVKNRGGLMIFFTNRLDHYKRTFYKDVKLEEIRQHVIADYQDHLEQEWLKYLNSKYLIKINQQLVKKIKSEKGIRQGN